ncbi:MAG: hypothetical protein ACD_45C00320G0001, partial [uncultured bacterium]
KYLPNSIIPVVNKLRDFGIDGLSHVNYVKAWIYNQDITDFMLRALEELKFKFSSHAYVYDIFLSGGEKLNVSRYQFSKIILKLESYFQSHPLLSGTSGPEHAEQRGEIEAIIQNVLDEDLKMTQGPLNKSKETMAFERILQKIIATDISKIEMRYDKHVGYVLSLPDEPEIFVNLLLNATNFTHIELSPEMIRALHAKINALTGNKFNSINIDINNLIVTQLPTEAQIALQQYCGDLCYKNMNLLFRGMPQTAEARYAWVSPVTGKENLLANLLCGSLVNWAAAEIPRLLHQSKERQLLDKLLAIEYRSQQTQGSLLSTQHIIDDCRASQSFYVAWLRKHRQQQSSDGKQKKFTAEELKLLELLEGKWDELNVIYPKYALLDRKERLSSQEGDETLTKRRLAHFVFSLGVTSVSAFPEGSQYFNNPGMTRTKFESGYFMNYPITFKEEAEIPIPQGTSFRYVQNPNGGFFAYEIGGPDTTPIDSYWPAVALATAYQDHLRRAYKDASHEVTVEGVQVFRPNHGLAHTYRVMTYIPLIISYFAKHAGDEAFKAFCQNITPAEIEWLKVAAAYSITGRNNEESAKENLPGYNSMKERCSNHLRDFFKQFPPDPPDATMQARMEHVVRYMGNPEYEKPPINNHENEEERNHQNFLHRILNMAHKLDLPRCYTVSELEQAMHPCHALVRESEEQQLDYQAMVRYAIDVLKAHGNVLRIDWQGDKMVDAHLPYRPPFGKVSTQVQDVMQVTATVPRLHFKSDPEQQEEQMRQGARAAFQGLSPPQVAAPQAESCNPTIPAGRSPGKS